MAKGQLEKMSRAFLRNDQQVPTQRIPESYSATALLYSRASDFGQRNLVSRNCRLHRFLFKTDLGISEIALKQFLRIEQYRYWAVICQGYTHRRLKFSGSDAKTFGSQ